MSMEAVQLPALDQLELAVEGLYHRIHRLAGTGIKITKLAVSQQLRIGRSTLDRMLATLVDAGLVVYDRDRGIVCMGVSLNVSVQDNKHCIADIEHWVLDSDPRESRNDRERGNVSERAEREKPMALPRTSETSDGVSVQDMLPVSTLDTLAYSAADALPDLDENLLRPIIRDVINKAIREGWIRELKVGHLANRIKYAAAETRAHSRRNPYGFFRVVLSEDLVRFALQDPETAEAALCNAVKAKEGVSRVEQFMGQVAGAIEVLARTVMGGSRERRQDSNSNVFLRREKEDDKYYDHIYKKF